MNQPQDRNPRDDSRHVVPSSRQVPGSSPSDTRSNAATGLTQQGLANQSPQGERHDPSSEMQAGSSRDGHTARQDLPGNRHREDRGTSRGNDATLQDENPSAPRGRA